MWNPGKTDWFGVNTWFDICNVCCVNPIKHAREILSRKGGTNFHAVSEDDSFLLTQLIKMGRNGVTLTWQRFTNFLYVKRSARFFQSH